MSQNSSIPNPKNPDSKQILASYLPGQPLPISLYDTYLKKDISILPQDSVQKGVLKIYGCGPTVYNYQHIGNIRAIWLPNTITNTALLAGWKTEWISNITDVGHLVDDGDDGEDKMEKGAKRENKTVDKIVNFYFEDFKQQCQACGLELPTGKYNPRATEYIKEQMILSLKLVKKGLAYFLEDGIYLDYLAVKESFEKEKETLSSQLLEVLKISERNEKGQDSNFTGRDLKLSEKKHPNDFALWKFVSENSLQKWRFEGYEEVLRFIDEMANDNQLLNEVTNKPGCPGWHSECVCMISQISGKKRFSFGGVLNDEKRYIYRIVEKKNLDIFKNQEFYVPKEFDRDGFIHLFLKNQVVEVGNYIFNKNQDLVLLKFDTAKINSVIKYEDDGNGKLYPHLYGKLETESLAQVIDFVFDDKLNSFVFQEQAENTYEIDIHTGGEDHIDIHHKNEIIQSEALGFKLSKTWVHNKFVMVDGGKMSKSLGNVYLVTGKFAGTGFWSFENPPLQEFSEEFRQKIVKKYQELKLISKKEGMNWQNFHFDPLAYRLMMFEHHYTEQMNFTWEKLWQSQMSLWGIRKEAAKLNFIIHKYPDSYSRISHFANLLASFDPDSICYQPDQANPLTSSLDLVSSDTDLSSNSLSKNNSAFQPSKELELKYQLSSVVIKCDNDLDEFPAELSSTLDYQDYIQKNILSSNLVNTHFFNQDYADYYYNFISPLADNLQTKKFLDLYTAAINELNNSLEIELIRDGQDSPNIDFINRKIEILRFLDNNFLKLNLFPEIDQQIVEVVKQRQEAKDTKDWIRSDQIRDEIQKIGWQIDDYPWGFGIWIR